jgi:hypothetical protein
MVYFNSALILHTLHVHKEISWFFLDDVYLLFELFGLDAFMGE